MNTTLEITNTWNRWHQMFQASYSRTSRAHRTWRAVFNVLFVAYCGYVLYSIDVLWLQVVLGLLIVHPILFLGRAIALWCYLGSRWIYRCRFIFQIDCDEQGLRIRQNHHEKQIPWADCSEFDEREDSFIIDVRQHLRARHGQHLPLMIPKDSVRDVMQLAELRTLAGSFIGSRVAE